MSRLYAAFVMGQGGWLFSAAFAAIAPRAQALGFETDVYRYTEIARLRTNVGMKRQRGYKTALCGYSLGVSTITELQHEPGETQFDLLLAVAASSLGDNYPITKRTKRSVLWAGPDFLSDAGKNLGFTETHEVAFVPIPVLIHLLMPSLVTDGVLVELAKLKGN